MVVVDVVDCPAIHPRKVLRAIVGISQLANYWTNQATRILPGTSERDALMVFMPCCTAAANRLATFSGDREPPKPHVKSNGIQRELALKNAFGLSDLASSKRLRL